jgi:hypothetical protein
VTANRRQFSASRRGTRGREQRTRATAHRSAFNSSASIAWRARAGSSSPQRCRRAREIGYDGIQFAGLMGHAPDKIRKRARSWA